LSGDVTLMRLLLEHGADPNTTTNDGATPLMAAAGINWVVAQTYSRSDKEYLEAARLCLERGNDVNAVNSQGFAAIHGAANRGFDAMIELLAAAGAKLDVKDKQGRTPMTFAEGVFLAVQPPVNKPSTIALLKKLTNHHDAIPDTRLRGHGDARSERCRAIRACTSRAVRLRRPARPPSAQRAPRRSNATA
jgi:hypothetical protein